MRLGAFFFEIMPLAGFFIGFHYYGLFVAALLSVGLAAIVLGLAWISDRYVAPFPLFSLLLSAGFTAAALLFDAAIFIKIQPTIFNGLFAAVLLGGLLMKRAMMQVFFAKQFFLTDDTWFRLSRRWGWFFLVLTIANELVWRHASDAHWVAYKTFIAAPASMLFMLAQLPLTLRGRVPPSKPDIG
jgi:intracellular septation protein